MRLENTKVLLPVSTDYLEMNLLGSFGQVLGPF